MTCGFETVLWLLSVLLLSGVVVLVIVGNRWMRWIAVALLVMAILPPLLVPVLFRTTNVDTGFVMRSLERDFGSPLPRSVQVLGFAVPDDNPAEYVVHFMVSSNDCQLIRQQVEARGCRGESMDERRSLDRAVNAAEERCLQTLKTVRVARSDLDKTVGVDGGRGVVIVMWTTQSKRWGMIWRNALRAHTRR